MSFKDLGLAEPIVQAVTEAGYENPTPIQAQAIPLVLEGRDVVGASQTGTGKTAAFALPSLSKISALGTPQILVLEPTRELAHQVAEQFEAYGKHTGCKVALLYGGVGYGEQTDKLKNADIVVATPGRLVDHFFRGTMRFGSVKILILDEVDRMLDMGFLPIVRKIVNLCPWKASDNKPREEREEKYKLKELPDRQTLFFSATMPPAIQGFANFCLDNPAEIEIARREVASTIKHAFYPVSMDQRDDLIVELLKQSETQSVMVFTRTRKEADTVCTLLNEKLDANVTAMHSDIGQKDRMKALAGFKDGTYDILVATDVAARGIDISSVSHVINYRVPENAEDYVHRIGRTGRAESEGDAFTILTADELDYANSVENFIGKKIERKKLEGFNYKYTALLDDKPAKPVRKKRPPAPKRRRR
ncbi:DEAD/DEAH box helicase [Rubritalea marina]|uniref:DEAD/DEAH box helicase n=1 Tax=Rubritalea marina TaxID=361055 RepID=UPI00037BE06D|nr:DEAD/DEAH box helicase [Rubritalea marina]